MAAKQDAERFDQMDDEMFRWYCAFYKLADDDKARDPDVPVEVVGLRRRPRPHQAFAALWMLLRGDGILGDQMGLGKVKHQIDASLVQATTNKNQSFIALLRIFLATTILAMKTDIARSRKNRDGNHHAMDSDSQEPCAASTNWPVQCACIQGSVTARIHIFGGPHVVVMPKGLISTWVKEFHLTFAQPGTLRLLVGHSATRKVTVAHNKNVRTIVVKQAADVDWSPLNMADYDQAWDEWIGKYENKKDPPPFVFSSPPQIPSNWSGYVILTTPGSFISQVRDRMIVKKERVKHRAKTPAGGMATIERQTFSLDCCRLSSITMDEFHLAKGASTVIMQAFKGLAGNGSTPQFWAMSGSPMTTGPLDLCGWAEIFQYNRPSPDAMIAQKYNKSEFNKMHNKFRKIQSLERFSSQNNDVKTVSTFLHGFYVGRMIRRKNNDMWFNKPIITSPPHADFVVKVELALDKETAANVEVAYENFKKSAGPGAQGVSRALMVSAWALRARSYGTVPYFANHTTVDLRATSLHGANLQQIRNILVQTGDDCPKLAWLAAKINDLGPDMTYAVGDDVPPTKMVIIAHSPFVSLCCYEVSR